MSRIAHFLVALGLLAGCKQDITVYRVAKQRAAQPQPAEAAAPIQGSGDLAWDVPKGWKAVAASGMRRASFVIEGYRPEQADVSVVALPGPAGGLASNLNRWRGQIGLGPLPEAELARQGERLRSSAGQAELYDFAGGGKRVLGAILFSGGMTWFFKLSGQDAVVARAKPDFRRFLGSLRLNG